MIKFGLLLAAFVVGCSGEDPVSTGVTDSALAGGGNELRTRNVGERPRLQFDALQVGGLQISWLEVQDSRWAEGAIVAATYADDGAVVDADLNDRYDTVDELFALLEEAVVSGADRCRLGGIRSAFISRPGPAHR